MIKKKLYTIMLPLFLLTGGCAEAQIKDVGSSEPVSAELAVETAAAVAKTEGPVDEWDLGFEEELAAEKAETAAEKAETAKTAERLAAEKAETAAVTAIADAAKSMLDSD